MNENNDFFENTQQPENLNSNPETGTPETGYIPPVQEQPVQTDFFSHNDFSAQFNDMKSESNENRSKSNVPVILLLILIFIMISALTVYCIYTDIQTGSVKFNEMNHAGREQYSLELNSKPESDRDIEYIDENGRYTTEGLAEYIRPQVVEIYAYNSGQPEMVIASGSGIIISEDGYIVTNTHVLDGTMYDGNGDLIKADSFAVMTHNEKQYDAQIAGRDTKTDIAVIKIQASGLPFATFGNSDETVLGEEVVAIGNPAGLTGSITDGIVSGLNRKIKADSTGFEMNCIQTNAAISPGNSGGALVNMYGQVIGITSSKYVNSSYEGLGFAITINEAKPIIEELISQGYVSGRIRIGITFYSMDNEFTLGEFKDKYNRDIPEKLKGLWITDISKDCDIADTELEVGDFILSVNGIKVHSYDDLDLILDGKKAGDILRAECARIDDDMNISYFEIEFKLMADTSGDF